EWIKNLSHVRFGRVGKRFEEAAFDRMLSAVEKATGRFFPPEERLKIARGADEIDLANSGPEEPMISAYHQIHEPWKLTQVGARLLGLAAFGAAAALPAGAALFVLRPSRAVWRVISVAAVAVAATGLAALVAYLAGRTGAPGSGLQAWSAVSVLRVFAAPLF